MTTCTFAVKARESITSWADRGTYKIVHETATYLIIFTAAKPHK
jgi:hypothetical protein